MIAKMRNMGEACTAANRFYVHESLAEEFAGGLARIMGAMKVGRGTEDGVEVGPLIDADQLAKVAELVDDAVARGARALCGGSRIEGPGHFYEPTVLVDVPADARLLREEIFGPVAPVRDVQHRGAGARGGQRHGVRARRLPLHGRPGARAAHERAPGDRDGRPQPGARLQRGRAVRRHQALRLRARGRPRGHARVPRDASTSRWRRRERGDASRSGRLVGERCAEAIVALCRIRAVFESGQMVFDHTRRTAQVLSRDAGERPQFALPDLDEHRDRLARALWGCGHVWRRASREADGAARAARSARPWPRATTSTSRERARSWRSTRPPAATSSSSASATSCATSMPVAPRGDPGPAPGRRARPRHRRRRPHGRHPEPRRRAGRGVGLGAIAAQPPASTTS